MTKTKNGTWGTILEYKPADTSKYIISTSKDLEQPFV